MNNPNLEKLNISLISSDNNFTVFSIKQPVSVFDGLVSAITNIITGTGLASSFIVLTPYIKYKENGIIGIAEGLVKGSIAAIFVSVIGICLGTYQCTRGIINTPDSIYSLLNGKIWDNNINEWVYYDLEKSIEELKNKELNYVSKVKPIDNTYYDILKIEPKKTNIKDIKKKYYKLAKEKHPDRNLNNPNAAKDFQLLGEAYQILSNPYLREKYDKYGIPDNKNKVLMDSKYIFESLFGDESFKDIIGDFYLYTILTTSDNDEIKNVQNKRIIDIAKYMNDIINLYISGEVKEFHNTISSLVKKMRKTNLGDELLEIIGNIYNEYTGKYSLLKYPTEIIENSYDNYTIISKFIDLISYMHSINNDNENEDENEEKDDSSEYDIVNLNNEYKEDMYFIILELSWYFTIIDIENTTRLVCNNVIYDVNNTNEIKQKKLEALKIIERYFTQDKGEKINNRGLKYIKNMFKKNMKTY